MKNKKLSYQIFFYSLIGIVVMIIYLACTSCGSSNKIPYKQGKKTWDCTTELGRFDTSCVIRENFFKGSTIIVYLHDDSCVVIWGKKCDIPKGEILYAKTEWWSTPPGGSHWRYFLINENETIRYSLLNR